MALYDRIVDPNLLVRRINVVANNLVPESSLRNGVSFEQMDLFVKPEQQEMEAKEQEREKRRQQAVLSIRKKYGKNAILKGMNLEEGATAKDRNKQIGGHKA